MVPPVLLALGLAMTPADPIVLARPTAVEGVVIDAEGKPAGDAEVSAFAMLSPVATPTIWVGRTDAGGRFRASLEGAPGGRNVLLVAYHTRLGIDRVRVSTFSSPEGPVRLALRPPGRVRVRVVGPDGQAMAGAKVRAASGFRREVPDELAGRLAVATDPDGRATLAGLPDDDLRACLVDAAGFGTQQFARDGTADGEWTLPLRRVGRLAGRVVADDPAQARGVVLWGSTWSDAPSRPVAPSSGEFRAVSDAEGRFEVPEMAAGKLLFSSDPTAPDLIAQPVRGRTIEAGGRTEVDLVLKRGIPVRGVVRERETGRPVAGAWFEISSRPDGGSKPTGTDAEGRFLAFLRPGEVEIRLGAASPYTLPDGPRTAMRGLRLATLSEGSAAVDLPPIELVRAIDIRGTVRDEAGKPAAGAEVEAVAPDGLAAYGSFLLEPAVRADERGAFVFKGMTPGVRLELTAQRGESASGPPVAVVPESGLPVELVIRPENTMSLGGRVVDERGRPIAGAVVTIRSRSKTQAAKGNFRGLWGSDAWQLRTDAEGRFQTPHLLRRHEEQQAAAWAPGRKRNQTGWFAPTTPSFFDLALEPEPPPEERAIRANFDAGWSAYRRGAFEEAETKFAATVKEAEERTLGTPVVLAWWLMGLGEAQLARWKDAEAEETARRVLALRVKELGPGHPDVATASILLALAREKRGDPTEAEQLLRRAVAIVERSPGVASPDYGRALSRLGTFQVRQGQEDQAEATLTRAIAILEQVHGPDGLDLIVPLTSRGGSLVLLGRFDEAEPFLRRALHLGMTRGKEHAQVILSARGLLAILLRETGRADEANALEAQERPAPVQ